MLAGASPYFDFPDLDEETKATTFYTTGTTGLPKGAMMTHRNYINMGVQITRFSLPIKE